tara:strand:- start:1705 stop:2052 length:348 start_codon:yes stop_codon:yes gene_type:complete
MEKILTSLYLERYSELLSKQFISIARKEFLTNEKAWQLFLDQPDSLKIAKHKLPRIKGILFGTKKLISDVLIKEIIEYNHCQIIPVLYSMNEANLSTELVSQSCIIIAEVLSLKD